MEDDRLNEYRAALEGMYNLNPEKKKLIKIYRKGKVVKRNKLSAGTRFVVATLSLIISSITAHILIKNIQAPHTTIYRYEVIKESQGE